WNGFVWFGDPVDDDPIRAVPLEMARQIHTPWYGREGQRTFMVRRFGEVGGVTLARPRRRLCYLAGVIFKRDGQLVHLHERVAQVEADRRGLEDPEEDDVS